MPKKPVLIVANRIGLHGETGVQQHCQMVLRHAADWGKRAYFISPWERPILVRRLVRLIAQTLKPVHRDLSFFWIRWAFDRLLRHRAAALLRSFGAERAVLYAQDPATAVTLLALKNRWPEVRVVLCAHYAISEASEYVERGRAELGDALTQHLDAAEQKALRSCDAVIFPSDFARQLAIDRLGSLGRDRLHVVPHVVEVDGKPSNGNAPSKPSSARDTEGECSGDVLQRVGLIAIGTLEPRKNQAFLIQLVAKLKDHGVQANLTLVGQGPSRHDLEQLACDLDISEQIRFTGLVVPAAPLIADHTMLVHASHVESFGIVLVEALSQGRPVGAPPVGAIPEIIRDGIEGVHLDLDDVASSALLVARLLGDPQRYRVMCEAALARYNEAFLPEKLLPRWRDAIG